MQWLADLIVGALRWVLDLFVALLKLLGVVVIDAVCYVLEGAGEFILWCLDQFDFSRLTSQAERAWNSLPSQLLDVAVAVGLNDCMAIIGTAILVRFALQLIPFTRLGS